MILRVRLFGYLAESHRKDPLEEFEFIVLENSTVENLLNMLGIPHEEVILVINPGEKERVLIAADRLANELFLRPNDRIWIYPFLDGG